MVQCSLFCCFNRSDESIPESTVEIRHESTPESTVEIRHESTPESTDEISSDANTAESADEIRDDYKEVVMFAWGSSVNGELGVGGIEEEHILTPLELKWPGSTSVTDAACGSTHTLFLTSEGKVFSCGNNDYGQLGHDQPRKRPQQVTDLDAYEIVSVACGSSHSLALSQWGQVFAWGSDSVGQLGHQLGGAVQASPKIIRTLATLNVVQIACGRRHSVALTNSGEIYTWGENDYGQLGRGKITPYEAVPTVVTSLAGIPIAFIACGGSHTFAVSKSGAVFGWGKNGVGQLGINDIESKPYPCQLRSLRNIRVRYISCGEDFSTFLTIDGGVFTCGAGNYGQLGHGGTTNEILPRKVSELMGSTITQVQCGRQHTLAFVPSRGRVYSFGLGGAGQLGVRKPGNALTPQIVLGPWVNQSGTSIAGSTNDSYSIKRIFAGGDHCFARVCQDKFVSPFDSRNLVPHSQILSLDYDTLHSCLRIKVNDSVDHEIISYLETVFKHVACMNSSFLTADNEHYCCSSRNHGVDLTLAEKAFSVIGKMENETIKNIIYNSITEDLIRKLGPSPADVEVLRVYLILPLYHEFNNPKQHLRLQMPFAQSLLSLKHQATRVISAWWNLAPNDYFEKLVIIFKTVAAYLIRNQHVANHKTIQVDPSLISMLEVLGLLNKLNRNVDGLKVPYDSFHISDLSECLDMRVDYVSWLTDQSNRFYLCNYPFIFDAQSKTQLLETDQAIQMQSAMNAAAQQALLAMFMAPAGVAHINQFLVLNVTRDHIVDDALRELNMVNPRDLKKPLKVKFCGEEAEDAGGVRKEFFMLLLREILDPKYGMFKEYEETRAIWFAEASFEGEEMYFLIGLVCGLAIYNFTIIDIPFPLALYKKLLNEPIVLSDMKGLSPIVANSLQSLLDYEGADLEDVFDLSFEITREIFDEAKVIPLKPDGENIRVNQENKKEYVNLYINYVFNESVAVHYNAFSAGFMKVCGGRVLELFHSHELMAVVVGNENYDWHALEEAAEYKNGYKSSDEVIRWFWEVLHEMPLTDKKKFLLYLTGSDRIPIQGMKAIKIIIQPTNDDKFLPVAHTCFNLLDLPKYKTKERLKYKLLQAIQQTEGFSLV